MSQRNMGNNCSVYFQPLTVNKISIMGGHVWGCARTNDFVNHQHVTALCMGGKGDVTEDIGQTSLHSVRVSNQYASLT